MNKIFCNENGNSYFILFGGNGKTSFLCNLNEEEYVICALLQKTNWWQGDYFNNFEEAYNCWEELLKYEEEYVENDEENIFEIINESCYLDDRWIEERK